MAILKSGPNGPFSGKVGSVIGSNWMNIDYIKGLPTPTKRKPSDEQIAQRERLRDITEVISLLRDAINKGWDKQKKKRGSAISEAIGYNIRFALDPECGEILFHRIKLSDGALPKASDATAVRTAPDCIQFRWNPEVRSFNTCAEDEATIVIFGPNAWDRLVLVGQYSRCNGQADICCSLFEQESVCHAYIFFTSPKGISSPTFYMKVEPVKESEDQGVELRQEDNGGGANGEDAGY